jgi:spore coat protein CotH
MNAALLLAVVLVGVPSAEKAGEKWLGLDKLGSLTVEIDAKEFARMQPPAPRFPGPFGGGPFGGGPGKPVPENTHRNTFGVDLPWVKGTLHVGDQKFDPVGVRYKGNYTLMASTGLKKSLKVDLNRHVAKQNLDGMKMLNLNGEVTDPFKVREAVTYAFFREAGLIAPRTGFVEVSLHVPGKHDKQLLGLYTLVEAVDKDFLKRHFKDAKGMLLKPEGLQNGLPHLGNTWSAYEKAYRPKDEPTEAQQKRLIAFTRLIDRADDATFEREIESYLEVDSFLRFVAANTLIANMDSYLGIGHNFYLYLVPKTDKFVFVPWDCDLSMGTWPVAGTPEQQVDLSVERPWVGKNKLLERLLGVSRFQKRYRAIVTELTQESFTRKALWKHLDQAEATLKEALARDKKAQTTRREGGPGPMGMGAFGASLPPRTFLTRRLESVQEQLAGKRKGFVPRPFGMGFGPPPR